MQLSLLVVKWTEGAMSTVLPLFKRIHLSSYNIFLPIHPTNFFLSKTRVTDIENQKRVHAGNFRGQPRQPKGAGFLAKFSPSSFKHMSTSIISSRTKYEFPMSLTQERLQDSWRRNFFEMVVP